MHTSPDPETDLAEPHRGGCAQRDLQAEQHWAPIAHCRGAENRSISGIDSFTHGAVLIYKHAVSSHGVVLMLFQRITGCLPAVCITRSYPTR